MSGVMVNLYRDIQKPGADIGNLIRHMVFSTLLSYKQKFGKEYGKLVLCADSKHYWRREYFPAYKGHRKHDREKSDFDWQIVFDAIRTIKQEIVDNFPIALLEVHGAEADDVIATMAKYTQDNELVGNTLFGGEPQKVLIISSDGDMVQLQKYKNVSQWNPQHKKWVKGGNVHEYLTEHICTGDAGDNIPNILTSDDWAESRAAGSDDKQRQTPFRKSRLADFCENGIDACKTEDEKRNYQRNKILVDFTEIPEKLQESILDTYIKYPDLPGKGKLMNYFMNKKMKLLVQNVQDFY